MLNVLVSKTLVNSMVISRYVLYMYGAEPSVQRNSVDSFDARLICFQQFYIAIWVLHLLYVLWYTVVICDVMQTAI